MPVNRLEIGLRGRHHHVVIRGDVEGAIAADAEIDAGGLDQRLDLRLDQAGRRRWGCDANILAANVGRRLKL